VRWLVPPAPVQASVKFVVTASGPTGCDPDVVFEPLHPPDAVQLVAFADDHVSVEVPLTPTDAGFALRLTVGVLTAATVTVAVVWVVPPLPVQLSV